MMHAVLFTVYIIVLSIMVGRSGFLRSTSLPPRLLIGLFLLYAAAGCAHAWIAYHYFPNHGDMWDAFSRGVNQKHLLLTDFSAFKKAFFPDSFDGHIASTLSGWSHLEAQMAWSLQIFFNFFSFNNMYINTLFFSFITMWGKAALFKVFVEVSGNKNMAAGMLIFLIPGILFWTSPIQKEGILYCALGIMLLGAIRLMKGRTGAKYYVLLLLGLLIVFMTRKLLLVTLIPGLCIWWLSEKTKWSNIAVLVSVTAVFTLIFIVLGYIGNGYHLFYQIAERQKDFMLLEGNSKMPLPVLSPTAVSFAKIFPYAFLNGYFMPLPGTGGKFLYNIFSIELIFTWLFILYAVWYTIKSRQRISFSGFSTFCLFFSLITLLIIGYIVPFAGAIVRYRSLFCPFLLFPFAELLRNHTLIVRANNILR